MIKANNQKRILHIMNKASIGGIPQVVISMYRAVDREQIHFDCTLFDAQIGISGKELQELGCHLYIMPIQFRHPFLFSRQLTQILKNGHYDVIHAHNSYSAWLPLLVAKMCGIKKRIAHAHTNQPVGRIKRILSHILTPWLATQLIGCTEDAAFAVFGKNINTNPKLYLLYNSIESEKFSFDQSIRDSLRKELNLNGKFVVGCIGRLHECKNLFFALRVFRSLHEINSNAHLVIVGDGPERENLEKYAREINMNEYVSFTGNRTDVAHILQAIDCFLMPSFHEGMPIAALEAIASGLPVFLSTNIPATLQFYKFSYYLPLSLSVEKWAEKINQVGILPDRKQGALAVKKSGLDSAQWKQKIRELY